jgi:hypothetical protein
MAQPLEGQMSMRRALPLFSSASLIHTGAAIGISAIAAVTSVPAWPALAVVTSTSIRLHLQAISILRRQLPAEQKTRPGPPNGGRAAGA